MLNATNVCLGQFLILSLLLLPLGIHSTASAIHEFIQYLLS